MSEDSIETLKYTAAFLALTIGTVALLYMGMSVAQNADAIADWVVARASAVEPRVATFFGFMAFFLWTTICSQCVINATTRAAKQGWALMLYAATWTLLVIFLLDRFPGAKL